MITPVCNLFQLLFLLHLTKIPCSFKKEKKFDEIKFIQKKKKKKKRELRIFSCNNCAREPVVRREKKHTCAHIYQPSKQDKKRRRRSNDRTHYDNGLN